MSEGQSHDRAGNTPGLRERLIAAYCSPPIQHAVLGVMKFSGREKRFVQRYMAQPGMKALQIGAGANRHEGWLHSNHFPIRPWGRKSFFLDATQHFPLKSESFDYVFCEHMIEHIDYAGGRNLVREAFRILKPGGVLRISTPDLDSFAGLKDADSDPEKRTVLDYVCREWNDAGEPVHWVSALNTQMRDWGHTFLYNEEILRGLFVGAGFDPVTRAQVDESQHEALRDLDNSQRLAPGMLAAISVVLEGVKPQP